MGKPAIYLLIDAFETVLYVGASRDYCRRVREHRRRSWWDEVALVEVYEQPTWPAALASERRVIHALTPIYNVQSNDPTRRIVAAVFHDLFLDMASPGDPDSTRAG